MKLTIPDDGMTTVGAIRDKMSGKADDEPVFVDGGRFVPAPEPVADVGDAPAPKKGKR